MNRRTCLVALLTLASQTAWGQEATTLKKLVAIQQAQIGNQKQKIADLQDRLDTFKVYNVSPDNPTSTPDRNGTWQMVDGLTKTFSLKQPARVVLSYSIEVSTIEDAPGQWVATRLSVNGTPLKTSGRHTQPSPSGPTPPSSDFMLAAQDSLELPAGTHTVELQWRSTAGIWRNHASEWYDSYGGIGGRTLTIMVFPQ